MKETIQMILKFISDISPRVKLGIIIALTLMFLGISIPIGRAIVTGALDGQDIVNIIEAFKGVNEIKQ